MFFDINSSIFWLLISLRSLHFSHRVFTKFPPTSPILVCSTKYDLPACVGKKANSLSSLLLSLSHKTSQPMCVCLCVCVSMHRQLWSQYWREGSARGAARKTVHPDSPPALYKDKGKRASQPLYLDGLYWASCLRLLLSCTPPRPQKSLTKGMWAAGKSEPDNDLGDNNRGEENRVGE